MNEMSKVRVHIVVRNLMLQSSPFTQRKFMDLRKKLKDNFYSLFYIEQYNFYFVY
jgi:hypothetical protein